MSDLDEILDYLEYIRQQKRPLSLVNTYKGVSLSLEVEVQKIVRSGREVIVAANIGRPISLLPATQIRIHSDLFPRPIQARVASVDIHHRTAVLRNFNYVKSDQESRKETRVQPKSEIKATVTIGGQNERKGFINDISVEGISLIFTDKDVELAQTYLPNTSVRIIYNLPVTNQRDHVNISVPAKVMYINMENPEEKYRVGFITYPKQEQRDLIRRYIFDLQTEFFNDLDQDSSSQSDPNPQQNLLTQDDTSPRQGSSIVL